MDTCLSRSKLRALLLLCPMVGMRSPIAAAGAVATKREGHTTPGTTTRENCRMVMRCP